MPLATDALSTAARGSDWLCGTRVYTYTPRRSNSYPSATHILMGLETPEHAPLALLSGFPRKCPHLVLQQLPL